MSSREPCRVAVVLGDPRLPDPTKVGGVFSAEDLDSVARLKAALTGLDGFLFTWLDDHATLVADLERERPDLVMNLCDTGFRNVAAHELHVPALLEMLAIPYTGSGPTALALCFDKSLVRAAAAELGLAVPRQLFVRAGSALGAAPIDFPALVKPNRADGSLGITQRSVVADANALRARIDELHVELPGQDLLVQEFLDGDELGITLIGNPNRGLEALPPMRVDYSGLDAGLPRILGYESKTVPDSPYWHQPRFLRAELDAQTQRRIVDGASALFERLGCRDYARFDFRAGRDGEPRLLEVNPNPAWCWDGKMNFMAGFAGLDYAGLLRRLLDVAWERVVGAR